MTRIRQTKTNFTAGEISTRLLGRGDLRAYENGALALRNLFIHPTGGVTRRWGMSYVDDALGDGRLISFEFNTEQTYLLVVTDLKLTLYADGVETQSLDAPWTTAQISQLAWTQSADTLLLVHRDVGPKTLSRQSDGTFTLDDWNFVSDSTNSFQPFFKFADSAVTITPSATSGSVSLTASADVFTADHENTKIRIGDIEADITDFDSATVVTATLLDTLPNTNANADWGEQAFSAAHGYPSSVAFHQDRLVIGGSRDLPNRLWFSKSGDLFNFDLGTGLDDESIEFAILSDQVNAIRGVFSGRHLQVFTSGGEWQVTGDPLTPETVQLNRQTRIGSIVERYIAPVDVDGATLFVARNKRELREFLFTDLEQAYNANDLALLARHIIDNPIDQDFDKRNRLLFLVMADGRFATVTIYRAEAVTAWTLHDTDGEVKSVAAVGDDVYMLVARNGGYTIEQFDETLFLDSSLTGTDGGGATVWSGLDHLEGKTVSIIADGMIEDDQIVASGQITLAQSANEVQIGLPYTHIIEPLPPSALGEGGDGRSLRLIEGIFRVENTAALRLDVGRGLADISLRTFGDEVLDEPPPQVSRDIRVRALGWQSDNTESLWRIEQSAPLPFTLLSVSTEIKLND